MSSAMGGALGLRVCAGIFVVFAALCAPPVEAQVQALTPPTIDSVDPYGTDITTAEFVFSTVEVQIGPKDGGGLTHARTYRGYGHYASWRDVSAGTVKLNYTMEGAVSAAVVSYDGGSATFSYSGGVYSPISDDGATLGKSGTIYTFTSRYGEVARFDEAYKTNHLWSGAAAIIIDIARPNGEVVTFHHKKIVTTVEANRIQSITNNYGYQIHYEYASDNPASTDYHKRTKAVGINNAYDYCDPLSNSCSGFSQTWPQVTYSVPSTNVERVANVLNQNTDYVYTPAGSGRGLTQIKNHSGTAVTSVTYNATTRHVTGITHNGVAHTYGSRTLVSGTVYVQPVTTGGTVTKYYYTLTAPYHITKIERTVSSVTRYTAYTRDSDGRVTAISNNEGRTTEYEYDTRGNVKKVTHKPKTGSGLSNIVIEAGYATTCDSSNIKYCNKPSWVEDAADFRTDYTYDAAHGGILNVTSPSPSGSAPYGSGDRPQTRNTYVGKTARYKIGASTYTNGSTVYVPEKVSACISGDNSCTGQARENVVTTAYETTSSPNNILAVEVTTAGGDGSATSIVATGWDAMGREYYVDGPMYGSSDRTYFQRDALGRTILVAGPDPDDGGSLKHRATRTTYNNDGEVTQIEQGTLTSPANWGSFSQLSRIERTYQNGRVRKRTAVIGSTTLSITEYGYDGLGRVYCETQRMDPATWSSLPLSACEQSGGAVKDRVRSYSYTGFDQVYATLLAFGAFPQFEYKTYTPSGLIDTLKDAKGNLTKYEYDGFDRLVKTYFPHPTSVGSYSTTDYEQLTYDSRNNVTQRRARDAAVFYFTPDNLNRMAAVNAPGSDPDVSYTYNQAGHILTASQSGHTLTYTYDAQGRMLSEAGPKGTVSYQYDAVGRRSRVDYPGAGSFYVTYNYNNAGDLTTICETGTCSGVSQLASYAYDDWGRRTSLTRGNGVVTSYAFDAAGRLQTLTNNLSGTADDQTLTFGYNPAHQITSRTTTNSAYEFSAYTTFTENYTNNGLNQTTSVGGVSLTHDARGNMTYDGSKTYTYDYSNRLKTATGGVTLSYDPSGRLYQVNSGGATDFLYDGTDIIAEYSGSTVLRRYVHGSGKDDVLVQYDGTGTSSRTFLIPDERGSVVAGTDSSGARTYVNRYDEYGQPQSGNSGLFQYTGQIWLSAVGLYHYKARVYSARLGRFLQPDPIGYAGGMNLHAYVGNDPVNSIDPSGLDGDVITVIGQPGGLSWLDQFWLQNFIWQLMMQEQMQLWASLIPMGLQGAGDVVSDPQSPAPDPFADGELTPEEMDEIVITAARSGNIGGVIIEPDFPRPNEQIWFLYPSGEWVYRVGRGQEVYNGGRGTARNTVTAPRGFVAAIHVHPNWGELHPSEIDHQRRPYPLYGIVQNGVWVIRPGATRATIIYQGTIWED